ncbi:MAG TPA: SMC-Scp complex subunit ScpB [Candidatus Nanoarchaeia archaeon]|nr:SMC-Scp complex subunit ScpB [Candidatus Nanoarchaeia archaeon]
MSHASKQVEALLFSSGKWMTEDQLAALIGLPKDGIKAALNELKQGYEQADSSLTLMNESDGWKLNVRENYLELVRKIVAEAELPRPLLQTLAVIAWKRPILQSEVADIRSASCYEHIAELEKKGFVVKEPNGRSYLLKLTPKFFEYFDIKSDADIKKVFENVHVPEIPLQPLQPQEQESNHDDILQKLEEVKKSIPPPEPVKPEEMQGFDDELDELRKRVDSHSEELKQFRRLDQPEPPVPDEHTPEAPLPDTGSQN